MDNLIDKITFVIPVRLGSSRIKNKVLLPFPPQSGLNLIEHKVAQIRKIAPEAQIILSCGEQLLYDLASKLDITISERVGKHINGHEVGTRESICEVIKDVETKYVAWTTVVTPLHDGLIIEKSLKEFGTILNEGSSIV